MQDIEENCHEDDYARENFLVLSGYLLCRINRKFSLDIAAKRLHANQNEVKLHWNVDPAWFEKGKETVDYDEFY